MYVLCNRMTHHFELVALQARKGALYCLHYSIGDSPDNELYLCSGISGRFRARAHSIRVPSEALFQIVADNFHPRTVAYLLRTTARPSGT